VSTSDAPTPKASRPALFIPKEELTDKGFALCERLEKVIAELRHWGPHHNSTRALTLQAFREHFTALVRKIYDDKGSDDEKVTQRGEFFSARDHAVLLLKPHRDIDPEHAK
jgi:hypothetical protein